MYQYTGLDINMEAKNCKGLLFEETFMVATQRLAIQPPPLRESY